MKLAAIITKANLIKLLKFGMVGLSGLVIDFGITYLFKEYLKWDKYAANTCGFSVAVVNNYFINRIWTFNSQEKKIAKQFTQFLLIALIGLGLNTLAIYLLETKLHIPFYMAKFIAILLVFIWNFTANATLTFKKIEPQP
jgi:putative flippase GtrA